MKKTLRSVKSKKRYKYWRIPPKSRYVFCEGKERESGNQRLRVTELPGRRILDKEGPAAALSEIFARLVPSSLSRRCLKPFRHSAFPARSSSRLIPTTPTRRKKSFWKTTAFRCVSFPAWATIMSTSPLPISNRTTFFRRSRLCRATERTAGSSAARGSMCWISSLCWRQTGGCRSLPAIGPPCGPACGIPACRMSFPLSAACCYSATSPCPVPGFCSGAGASFRVMLFQVSPSSRKASFI